MDVGDAAKEEPIIGDVRIETQFGALRALAAYLNEISGPGGIGLGDVVLLEVVVVEQPGEAVGEKAEPQARFLLLGALRLEQRPVRIDGEGGSERLVHVPIQ